MIKNVIKPFIDSINDEQNKELFLDYVTPYYITAKTYLYTMILMFILLTFSNIFIAWKIEKIVSMNIR